MAGNWGQSALQTDTVFDTIYMGVQIFSFFLSVRFAPSLLALLVGG